MNEILTRLNQIPYKKIVWILAISETFHNLEEGIWLPDWSQTAGVWHSQVGDFEFRFAVILLTLLFYGIIYYFSKSQSRPSVYMLGALLVIILGNVFMPHLIATILLAEYVPGVITGVILNVPVTLYLLNRGIKEGIFNFGSMSNVGVTGI